MKNIKYTICVFFAMLATIPAIAQKEASNWFFGNRCGLTFLGTEEIVTNTVWGAVKGLPKGIAPGQCFPISIYEGCFTISDKGGNFLFASDGMTVYNKNMQVMANGTGLLGHPSSTQSGIVTPKPGDPNRYYVITVPAIGGPGEPGLSGNGDGMQYSEVNLRANNGLGEVLLSNKKTKLSIKQPRSVDPLNPPNYQETDVSENITVVGHYNGIDYWMISKIKKHYYVWKITKDGFSDPTAYYDGNESACQGVIKLSPDGKRVAHISHGLGSVAYADFDPKTGVISNTGYKQFYPTASTYYLYSLEFSIDGEYLYLAPANPPRDQATLNGLYVTSMAQLKDPAVTTLTRLLPYMTNMQLGADGRMYGVHQESPHLWVILDAKDGGKKIHQMTNFFNTSYMPRLGLPTFITSFFGAGNLTTTPADVCSGEEVELAIQVSRGSGLNQIDKIVWDFGDGNPTEETNDWSSNTHKIKHTFQKAGEYTITITPYYGASNPIPNSPVEDKIAIEKVTVGQCMIPVNHNITNMGY